MREDVLICRKCSIKYLKVIRKPVVNLFSNECRKKMFALQLQLCFKINYVYIHIYIHTHTHEVISYESDLLLPVCSFLVYPSKKIFCNHKHRQFLCHPCISSSSLHPLSSLLSLSNICVSASMCFAGYPGATWWRGTNATWVLLDVWWCHGIYYNQTMLQWVSWDLRQPIAFTCFIISFLIIKCMCAYFRILNNGPGWCGSVDWVPACKPNSHQFNSQSGHMPRLQARFLVGGVQEATNWCVSPTSMFLSLSFSLLSPLSRK